MWISPFVDVLKIEENLIKSGAVPNIFVRGPSPLIRKNNLFFQWPFIVFDRQQIEHDGRKFKKQGGENNDGCKVKFLSSLLLPTPPPTKKNMSVLATNANLKKKIIVNHEKFYCKFHAPYILYTINPLPLEIY